MTSDSPAARPGAGAVRTGSGSDSSGRNERVTRPETTAPQPVAEPSNGTSSQLPGSGRPTEVYDQVRRQWVGLDGQPVEPPKAAETIEPVPETGAVVTAVPTITTRKARLVLRTVDPWSVMKLSFVLSLAGAIVLIVTVWLMWMLLSNGGVFVSVDKTVGDIAGSTTSISIVDIFSLRRVMGVALMLAVIQVVLVTALATLIAFLYNLASGLVGGLDITLSEDR